MSGQGAATPWLALDATIAAAGGKYKVVRTQTSFTMEGRPIVRSGSLEEYRQHPAFAKEQAEDTSFGAMIEMVSRGLAGDKLDVWVDRIVPPTFTTYPVAQTGSFYSVGAWRMREFQDAIPIRNKDGHAGLLSDK